VQAASDEKINRAKADGIAAALIDDVVEVAIGRIIAETVVAFETQFFEQVKVNGLKNLLGAGGHIDALAQTVGPLIVEGLIRVKVDVRVLSARQQTGPLLQVEFLAISQAKREKRFVIVLTGKMGNDLEGAAAQNGVGAQEMGLEPFGGVLSVGEELIANGAVNGRVIIREERNKGISLFFRELYGPFLIGETRLHFS